VTSDEQFLRAFGERVRGERARRGMSRKLLADHAGISERYITQLESGKGNASILILRQIASALGLPLTRLVEDESLSAEMTLLRQFLARLSPEQLKEAHASLASSFAADAKVSRTHRIALVGLRGAGKTTIGAALARELKVPFIELDREIERLSGTSLASIIELYGQQAYRRYELEGASSPRPRRTSCSCGTATPSGSARRPRSTWPASSRRAIAVRWPAPRRQWRTCVASSASGRRCTRRRMRP
jgi:XRE family aerobic/anaerobic benzoate catabolism transcriptional regulator